MAFLFYSFKSFEHEYKLSTAPFLDFEVEFIEPTKPDTPKPPPSRPPIPVEAEIDEFVPDIPVEIFKFHILAFLGNPLPLPQLEEFDVWNFEVVQQRRWELGFESNTAQARTTDDVFQSFCWHAFLVIDQ